MTEKRVSVFMSGTLFLLQGGGNMARKQVETADSKTKMETPEHEIVRHPDFNVAFKSDSVIVFQAKHLLTEDSYDMLSTWTRKENEASGLKIVVAPYSVDVKVGVVNGD